MYLSLREGGRGAGGGGMGVGLDCGEGPITTRQLESLIRLAQVYLLPVCSTYYARQKSDVGVAGASAL